MTLIFCVLPRKTGCNITNYFFNKYIFHYLFWFFFPLPEKNEEIILVKCKINRFTRLIKGMEPEKKDKMVIGRREVANLPEFGLDHVDVKVDSGAYTSSIHVSHCVEILGKDGPLLEVIFLDSRHASFDNVKHYFKTFRIKKVKSSTGHDQMRYFIKCTIELMGRKIKTEFSLTERKGMRFPILLGRRLLNKRFIIDTSLVNVSKQLKIEK
jgi:hypothetical protein